MKNLFDYATKELSQDAFIRWLLENYNDPELGEYSKEFLYFLVGERFEFDHLKTFAQVDKIDVSVDIYKEKNSKKHDTLVIEDKTGSSEHKQLCEYDEVIKKKWRDVEKIYRVFYKTSPLSDEDIEGIELANKGLKKRRIIEKLRWQKFDIEKIYGHFKGKATSKSQIYNDYVKHIEKIYNDYKEVSKETADKWSPVNWSTFFKKYMEEHHPGIHCYTTNYRGMYESLIVNYDIPNNEYLKCATFEIIVRSKLHPYLHPSFKIVEEKEHWYWSINDIKDNKKETCKKELLELRVFIESRKSKTLVRGNTARSFANIKELIDYKGKSAEEVWKELDRWISEYISAIGSFVNRK